MNLQLILTLAAVGNSLLAVFVVFKHGVVSNAVLANEVKHLQATVEELKQTVKELMTLVSQYQSMRQ